MPRPTRGRVFVMSAVALGCLSAFVAGASGPEALNSDLGLDRPGLGDRAQSRVGFDVAAGADTVVNAALAWLRPQIP